MSLPMQPERSEREILEVLVMSVIDACAKAEGFASYQYSDWSPEGIPGLVDRALNDLRALASRPELSGASELDADWFRDTIREARASDRSVGIFGVDQDDDAGLAEVLATAVADFLAGHRAPRAEPVGHDLPLEIRNVCAECREAFGYPAAIDVREGREIHLCAECASKAIRFYQEGRPA